jgi:PPOX class probable F420-dependent enzyme
VSLSPATAEDSSRQEAIGGYFAPLASAKHVLLTTFKPGRPPVSTRVRVVADGDRAYLKTWVPSGTARRLRDADWVQVGPCTFLGLVRYGPRLDAAPRLLDGEEASQATRKLARELPARRHRLVSLAYRLRRGHVAYYELAACGGANIPEAD